MLEWVEQVLKPYVSVGIIPILFLDSFSVHLLGSISDAIQNLGVEIEFIPGGCLGLVQPIDVGINKPFKSNMKKLYTDFIMGQDPDGQIRGATRIEVSGWILEAVGQISEATTKNVWRKTGYSYYP